MKRICEICIKEFETNSSMRIYSRRQSLGRIIPLNYDYDIRNAALYGTEKYNYVEGCIQSYMRRGPILSIYMGNGRNDIKSMKRVKEKGGYVICPSNSRRDVKAIANYVSDKEDLESLTEAFSRICGERENTKRRETDMKVEEKDKTQDNNGDYDY